MGAQSRDVLGLVLAQGLRLAAAGILIGAAGALALTRLIRGLLFGRERFRSCHIPGDGRDSQAITVIRRDSRTARHSRRSPDRAPLRIRNSLCERGSGNGAIRQRGELLAAGAHLNGDAGKSQSFKSQPRRLMMIRASQTSQLSRGTILEFVHRRVGHKNILSHTCL